MSLTMMAAAIGMGVQLYTSSSRSTLRSSRNRAPLLE